MFRPWHCWLIYAHSRRGHCWIIRRCTANSVPILYQVQAQTMKHPGFRYRYRWSKLLLNVPFSSCINFSQTVIPLHKFDVCSPPDGQSKSLEQRKTFQVSRISCSVYRNILCQSTRFSGSFEETGGADLHLCCYCHWSEAQTKFSMIKRPLPCNCLLEFPPGSALFCPSIPSAGDLPLDL